MKKHKALKPIVWLILDLGILVLAMYIMFGVILGVYVVSNSDMSPKYAIGDIVVYYRLDKPNTGDAAIISVDNKDILSRVEAKSGDTVSITDKAYQINGHDEIDSEIYNTTKPYDNSISYPIALQDNEYFVLSDYRDATYDSRSFGPISSSQIKGTVLTVIKRNGL